MATINEIIRIDDVKSDIDVRNKASQVLATIDKVDSEISSALNKVESLKNKSREEHKAGWSFGGKDKRLAIEALQAVTRDMADSQEEILQIQKSIVEGQKMLNQHTTILYQLGAMSLAANRMVHRELKLKLETASREELSELARQELLNTIQQIEQMQDTLIQQEKQKAQLNQQAEKIYKLEKDNDRLRSDMAETDNRFSARADVQKKEITTLISSYKKLNENINQNKEKNSKDIQEIKKDSQRLGERLQKLLNQQATQLKQDEKLISKLREEVELLLSELSGIESKLDSQAKIQNNTISEMQNNLQILNNNISNLEKYILTEEYSFKNEIELLKKFSYSKNKVLLMLALGILISVIFNIIMIMFFL